MQRCSTRGAWEGLAVLGLHLGRHLRSELSTLLSSIQLGAQLGPGVAGPDHGPTPPSHLFLNEKHLISYHCPLWHVAFDPPVPWYLILQLEN